MTDDERKKRQRLEDDLATLRKCLMDGCGGYGPALERVAESARNSLGYGLAELAVVYRGHRPEAPE